MKAQEKPKAFAGIPNHTPADFNKIFEHLLREQYGPQAEAIKMFKRITQQFMIDTEVAQVQPKGGNK